MRPELVHDGSTDLLIPRPAAGEEWNPETIHTHFFECAVPEAGISIFTYIRYLPAFGVCQGGVLIYQGLDNVVLTDLAFGTGPHKCPGQHMARAVIGIAVERLLARLPNLRVEELVWAKDALLFRGPERLVVSWDAA